MGAPDHRMFLLLITTVLRSPVASLVGILEIIYGLPRSVLIGCPLEGIAKAYRDTESERTNSSAFDRPNHRECCPSLLRFLDLVVALGLPRIPFRRLDGV